MKLTARTALTAMIASVVIAAGLGLVSAPAALAGTYTVYGCRTPGGGAAPMSGWSDTLQVYPAYWQNSCPTAALMWMSADAHADGRYAEETFVAPPGTTIQHYTLVRAVRLAHSAGYYYQAYEQTSGYWTMVEGCNTYNSCHDFGDYQNPTDPSNVFSHSGDSATTAVQLKILCGMSGGCPSEPGPGGVTATAWLFQSQMTLQDNSAPKFTVPPTGPLVGGGVLAGIQPVTIAATDSGSGVYQAEIEVDGRVVQSQALDNTGTCQQPFVATVPCPLSANGTAQFNTASIPDGTHTLRLLVTDAAGNTAAWGPVTITTVNNPCSPVPAVPGLTVSAGFVRHVHKRIRLAERLTTSYSRRPVVVGSLTSAGGAPVGNAPMCVAVQDAYPGAPIVPVASLSTNNAGGFAYRLMPGPSRTVYFIHRVPGGAIAGSVRLNVRVPVRVHLNSHRFLNGQVMTWHGRLPGPIPAGTLAIMQVWRGNRWQIFQNVAVLPGGKWVGRYRFEFTQGAQPYTFRLFVPHQSGYPYAAGWSRPMHVTVTG
jgi:hypothetical protein